MKRARRSRRMRNRQKKRTIITVLAVILAVGILAFCMFYLKACDSFVPLVTKINPQFSESEMNSVWDDALATHINFNGNAVEISGGDGASASGQTIMLSKGGTYVLTGSLSSGKVLVSATTQDDVCIVLNGVSLHNTVGSALMIEQADTTHIIVADGTQNSITDASVYSDISDNEDAALFAKDDLSIAGGGKLVVNGKYKHGIVSKNDLKIYGADIKVNSVGDGLIGRDVFAAVDSIFNIVSGGDGIQADNTEETALGNVLLENCIVNIESAGDCIQAESSVQTTQSTLVLKSGGGSINSSDNANWGTWGTAISPTSSAKGLKGNRSMLISGGTISADTSDDALYSGGNMEIDAESMILASGDDAICATSQLAVKSGTIDIEKAFMGITAASAAIYDGQIEINSTDDGINIGGGINSVNAGRKGAPSFDTALATNELTVANGAVNIHSNGDGVDSAGNVVVSGNGKLNIAISNSNTDNVAIASKNAPQIKGSAEIMAVGMGKESVSVNTDKKNTVTASLTQPAAETAALSVCDKNDKEIMTFAPNVACDAVFAVSSKIKEAQMYSIKADGVTVASVKAGADESGNNIIEVTDAPFSPVATTEPTAQITVTETPNVTVDVTIEPTLEPIIEPTATIRPTLTIKPTIRVTPSTTPKPTIRVTPTNTPKPTV
ncbi:MAG: carbohydrate-binding domain-containing protein, partial [Clostridia bacterium]|nr:carbohydrate-binding domain-containing protein [Clostridia bacterium]